MLTVLESINRSAEYLEKKGIELARLNAELLLSSILKCKRLDLYLKFDQPLKEEEINLYREYIARRGRFEPLQYITGSTEFYGLNLKITPAVLIPRPETELLVEAVICAVKDIENPLLLDIGSGSGNISISLAKNLTASRITALDISAEAIELAKENAIINSVEDRIEFVVADILDGQFMRHQFDAVVSNPPYVSAGQYSSLQKEITEYEPALAVTDYGKGFKFYEAISNFAKENLKTNGLLFFEMGFGQSEVINSIMEKNGFTEIKIIKDFQQIDRVIFGIKK